MSSRISLVASLFRRSFPPSVSGCRFVVFVLFLFSILLSRYNILFITSTGFQYTFHIWTHKLHTYAIMHAHTVTYMHVCVCVCLTMLSAINVSLAFNISFTPSLQTFAGPYTAIRHGTQSILQSQCHNMFVKWRNLHYRGLKSAGDGYGCSLAAVILAPARPGIGETTQN